MNVILLTVTKPRSLSPKQSLKWNEFVCIAKEKTGDNADATLLSESALSIRGKNGLYPFAQILVAAHEADYPYSVNFFGNEKSWSYESQG